jgi:hypothetical protein
MKVIPQNINKNVNQIKIMTLYLMTSVYKVSIPYLCTVCVIGEIGKQEYY